MQALFTLVATAITDRELAETSKKSYSMDKHFIEKHVPFTPSLSTLSDDPERDNHRRVFDIDGLGMGYGADATKELYVPAASRRAHAER